jgi:hypothetical protein
MIGKVEELRDPIVQSVIEKFSSRSDVGFKKYGVTLEDDHQGVKAWLNHLQEELMDAVNYLEKAMAVLDAENAKKIEVVEPKVLDRSNVKWWEEYRSTGAPHYFWDYGTPRVTCNCGSGWYCGGNSDNCKY